MDNMLTQCRARKVRCDEAKPVCHRCKSTGRTCDGYGVWGGGGNTYSDRYCTTLNESLVCKSPKPFPASKIGRDEGDCMQWLHSKIMRGTSSFFDRTFWADLVVPTAWSVPAVAHAVVAIGAALRGVVSRRQGLPDTQQQFTLRQYTKAIQLLQPLLSDHHGSATTPVLVTCLLFTILEYLREQYRAAAVHLHNGLKLLKGIHSDSADRTHGIVFIRPAAYNRAIHRAIFRVFATLHLQANLFGNHLPDVSLLLQTTEEEIPSPIFASLEEARDSLDKLLHGMLLLKRRVEGALASSGDLSFSLIESREVGLCRLRMWRATYETTVKRLPASDDLTVLAYKLLLNNHAMAKIICTSMFSTSELVYCDHTNDFLEIIRHSAEVWNHYAALQGTVSSTRMTTEAGWIPPLYYTALKCRVPRIRSHAIKLLSSVAQKEGVWDSILAANVAEKVSMLETRHDFENVNCRADFALHEVPNLMDLDTETVLSESNLLSEVQVELSESSNMTLVCKKRQLTDTRCRFDGERWHDIYPVYQST